MRTVTIKQFQDKYHITHHLAWEAAAITQHTDTMERDNDYLESDLIASLLKVIQEKLGKSIKKADGYKKTLKEVTDIAYSSGILNQ